MSVTSFVIIFIIYSVIGWMVDTSYRSLEAGRYTPGGFSRIPFSPVFGIGGFLSVLISSVMRPYPFVVELCIFALFLGAYEYVSGVVVVHTFKRRLWDYSTNSWNFHGHTAVGYAFGWAILGMLIAYYVHPFLLNLFG